MLGQVEKSVVLVIGGESIGIVGYTTTKTHLISAPGKHFSFTSSNLLIFSATHFYCHSFMIINCARHAFVTSWLVSLIAIPTFSSFLL